MRLRLGLAVLLAAAAGCQEGSAPNADSGGNGAAGGSGGSKALRIAVIPKGTTHEFWKSVHAGARKAADELGDVEILWKGPLNEEDTDAQISLVQGFITSQVDGIVLAPNDSQSLVPAVQEANDEDIPVVIFDSGLREGAEIVSYVATDNRKAGKAAGRYMGELLGGKGDVILLRYKAGSESTEQREEGFLEALRTEFPDVNILLSNEYAGTRPQEALDKASQILGTPKYRDAVDGIFAVCEPNAEGVLGALDDAELEGKVKFVAFDPSPTLIRAMRDGHVHGIVLQDPVTMGYEAVKTIVNHIRGEGTIPPRIDTGEYIATPENMDEERMRQLLHPEQHED